MNEIFKEFILGFITLLVTVVSTCLVKLISAKIDSIASQTKDEKKLHFLNWVENDLIIKCINTTNQTYVQSLKASNSFDKAAQEEAMNKTVTAVTSLLTETNATLLSEYVGDTTTWITTCVENYIRESKK